MSYMSDQNANCYGVLFEVDLTDLKLESDPDETALYSIKVRVDIEPDRIIGHYRFGHPDGMCTVFDPDNHFRTKCIEVIKGSTFKVGYEVNVPVEKYRR